MMAKLVGTWQACSHTVSEANLLIPILLKLGWLGQDGMPITTQPRAAGARAVPCNCLATMKFMSLKDASAGGSWADTLGQWCQRSWITRHITVQFRRPQLFVPCLRNLSQCSRDFLHFACAPFFKSSEWAACLEAITRETDWNLTKSWVPLNIPDWPRVYKTYM